MGSLNRRPHAISRAFKGETNAPHPDNSSVPLGFDRARRPSFSVNNATAAEDASSLVVTVRKHGRLNGLPSTVTLYTLDGTAKAGSDYVAQRATHSFTAAETSKKIVVGLVNDATPEGARRSPSS